MTQATGVCSYVQKHVIEALEGFSKFSANEVSKVQNIVFVIQSSRKRRITRIGTQEFRVRMFFKSAHAKNPLAKR